jgi:hypothetical protein
MAVGTIAPLGYAKETTPGTAVSAATWIPMLDGSGDTDINLQFPELIANSRQVNRYALLGEQKTRGMVKYNLFPDMGIDMIVAALAPPTGTTPHWAGTYVPTAGILPSYTIELQKGSIQTFRLIGSQVDKLHVTAESGKQVEIQLDLFALDYVKLGTPGTPAYTTSDPANFATTVVNMAGVSPDTDVTKVTFTLDNHMIEQWTLQGATAVPKRLDAAKTTLSGSITKYFGDTVLYDAYRAKTYESIAIAWTFGGNSVTFTIPKAAIKTHKQPVKLGEFIMQEFDFTAVYDSGVGGIVQLVTA